MQKKFLHHDHTLYYTSMRSYTLQQVSLNYLILSQLFKTTKIFSVFFFGEWDVI